MKKKATFRQWNVPLIKMIRIRKDNSESVAEKVRTEYTVFKEDRLKQLITSIAFTRQL